MTIRCQTKCRLNVQKSMRASVHNPKLSSAGVRAGTEGEETAGTVMDNLA